MIISVRRLIRFLQMWILIVAGTLFMYQALHLIHYVLWQNDPYHPPKGRSIKVQAAASHEQPWYMEDLQRLRVFYITGE
ncbi:YqzK family protein [Fodinisporobacter ferrooxydans]|uniref:YqzK family protein n=1 Tax=Fodinisporobacter ferrooxydans TaxID=2901836 RepID=A0ABY4CL54_9BACL|nr:YqzK family protein [Alicyclobacillaceae bacterium MYW30-H2]